MTDEGYLRKNGSTFTYYYHVRDHLGNTRVVMDGSGNLAQVNNYYPFGFTFAEPVTRSNQGVQPYKYNGKELDGMYGMNLYDYGARFYDPALSRFMTMDPMAEKYYSVSPYAYCLNNPVRFIDPDGKDPGDVFKTKNAAAKDWGNYYNGASIVRGLEFSSSIYSTTKNGKFGYAYSGAAIGGNDNVKASPPPGKEKVEGLVHSHGEYEINYINNEFSNRDKWVYYNNGVDGYVATPDGSLQKYDPKTGKTDVISTNLPSDPKDPDRKNEKTPVDIPKENEYQKQNTPEKKREEYKNSYNNR